MICFRFLGLAIFIFMLIPGTANSCRIYTTLDGYDFHWPQDAQPVPYYINMAGSDDILDDSEIDAIKGAFETWSSVECANIEFEFIGFTDETRYALLDNINIVTFQENDWPEDDYGLIAKTYIKYSTENGELAEFGIVLNGSQYFWSTNQTQGTDDVENVMVKQIGNILGLAYSDNSEASMYSSMNMGEIIKRDLHEDDITAICELYEPGRSYDLPTPPEPPETSELEDISEEPEPDPGDVDDEGNNPPETFECDRVTFAGRPQVEVDAPPRDEAEDIQEILGREGGTFQIKEPDDCGCNINRNPPAHEAMLLMFLMGSILVITRRKLS